MLLHPVAPAPAVVVATPTTAPQLIRWSGYPPAYGTSHTQEEPMHTGWHVHRTVRAQHDGERRWDYAYQFLLQWAMEPDAGSRPAPSHHQEASHGRRSLRPSCNDASTTAPDDCTATQSFTGLRCDAPRLVC